VARHCVTVSRVWGMPLLRSGLAMLCEKTFFSSGIDVFVRSIRRSQSSFALTKPYTCDNQSVRPKLGAWPAKCNTHI
jgi:hypothetical protein